MGRGKIEIRRIENTTNRQVTFSKRRGGLLKKAHELAVLTDAKIGLIVFSASGKLYQYHSPCSSMEEIIDGFQKAQNTHFDILNSQQLPSISQPLHCEMAKIRHETDKLQLSLKQITEEDLNGLTVTDLDLLEKQLDISVSKVCKRRNELMIQDLEKFERKNQLIIQRLENIRQKIMIEQQVVMEEKHDIVHKIREIREMGSNKLTEIREFLDNSRSLLQLDPEIHPFQLQPIQPNLQEVELHGHKL